MSKLVWIGIGAGAGLLALTAMSGSDSSDSSSKSDSGSDAPSQPDNFGDSVDNVALLAAVAKGVAVGEGFQGQLPDGTWNNPAIASKGSRFNNPGDIFRAGSPVTYSSMQDGWNALYDLLHRIFTGGDRNYPASFTMIDFAHKYTNDDYGSTILQGWYSAVERSVRSAGFDISPDMNIHDFWQQRSAFDVPEGV